MDGIAHFRCIQTGWIRTGKVNKYTIYVRLSERLREKSRLLGDFRISAQLGRQLDQQSVQKISSQLALSVFQFLAGRQSIRSGPIWSRRASCDVSYNNGDRSVVQFVRVKNRDKSDCESDGSDATQLIYQQVITPSKRVAHCLPAWYEIFPTVVV